MRFPPAVELKEISVTFDDRILFDSLSLTLKPGEWTSLLGRSGTGKSTFARMVVGLDVGTGAKGRVSDSLGRSLAGRAAWMAQEDLLLPWLTVVDNVALGSRLREGTSYDATRTERARELLEQVGLAGTEADFPSMLSGGMRQRVALARTLMEEREVIVLDEPFAAVDAITRAELQLLAFDLLQNRTILLITHDPLEALRLGHNVYVLQSDQTTSISPIPLDGVPMRHVDSPEVARAYGNLLRELGGAGQ